MHTLFCIQHCSYCYYKTINLRGSDKQERMVRHVNALCREIELGAQKYDLKKRRVISIYFGGGTPSLLHEKQIERIGRALHDNFTLTDPFDCAQGKLLYRMAERLSAGLEVNEIMLATNMDEFVRSVRHNCTLKWGQPVLTGQVPPVHGMARLTREAQALILEECIRRGLSHAESEQIVKSSVIDRSIGDIDARAITEEGYTNLAEQLGIMIPGERPAGGEQYQRIRHRMQEIELELMRGYGLDLRMYDIYGVGNPILREQLSRVMANDYGILFPVDQIFLSLGISHGMNRAIRMLRKLFLSQGQSCVFGFPAPGWAAAKWQAETTGIRVCLIETTEDANYKLTPQQLDQILVDEPDLRMLYLTITNNPTAYSYSPEELARLFSVVSAHKPELVILADLAYIGTADPEMDRSRMQVFKDTNVIGQTIFVSSLSKTCTLTGDRFGWVSFGNRRLADFMSLGWTNFSGGLPREWQLSFMAYLELFQEKPDLVAKIRGLYAIRRARLISQLQELNVVHALFDEIGRDEGGGIYNWSKFKPSDNVFTLFEKTGIVGVPGSAFGYDDRFVRFSVGIVPT